MSYTELEARFKRLSALHEAEAMLHWDAAAVMPASEKSSEARAEQLAELAEIAHGIITAADMGDLIAKAESEANLNDWQHANLHEIKRHWQHATAIPAKLVSTLSKATSASELAWREAKKTNNFAAYAPKMQHVLDLTREAANHKAQALGLSAYDALLDSYEPGARSADIDAVFADLREFLPGFTQEAIAHHKAKPAPLPLEGSFPTHTQKALGERFMKALGFDFSCGRLDESAHPFCGGVPADVRLTTRYNDKEFLQALFGILHETGHALYEQGLPTEWLLQPVGEARGMSMHESQSLFVEMQLSRSREFLTYAAPIIREAFGVSGKAWEDDNLYAHITAVEAGFIRVHADEVTYPSHILLRYDLEKQLVAGTLSIAQLPDAWNAGIKELLGLTPETYAQGCLQDIHWPEGLYGYFPTYTLGAMTAAQLFAAARKNIKDLPQLIQKGEFAPLVGWLRKNVHSKASSLTTREILTQATGKALDASIYKEHLKARYL